MTAFKRLLPLATSLFFLLAGLVSVGSAPALAVTSGPQWTITAVSAPTSFEPGDQSGDDEYKVLVTNTGGADSNGEKITITDTLPEGLTLDRAGVEGHLEGGKLEAQQSVATLACEGLTCTFAAVVIPQQTLVVTVPVDVQSSEPATVTNLVRVSGGGAPDATMSTPTSIGPSPAGFGIAPGSTTSTLSSDQAGAHADLTTTIGFDTIDEAGTLAEQPKEIVDDLPPGFAGDLIDTPACPIPVFSREACPIETQVGLQTLTFAGSGATVRSSPVYNLTPAPGEVAKIGFSAFGYPIEGDVTVLPGDYGLQTRFENIRAGSVELDGVSLTVWGVPTETIHNAWRWNPHGVSGSAEFGVASTNPLVPYLSNPTSCTAEPVDASITAYSWLQPETNPSTVQTPFGPFVDCDRLKLPAMFVASPTTQEAYAPTGLDAELGVHQTYENAEGLASAHLNKAVVTLPEGMTVNPSAGAGLGSCSEAQFEQYRSDPREQTEEVSGEGCPNESKLGSVKIVAPAIKEAAEGSVYLATPAPRGEPGNNPFNSLLALYVVARIPNRGVIVTSAGRVIANPITGQLTTVFENLPQLPFTTFTLSFRQGETSPLVTPPACGSFVATAQLTPWSNLAEVVDAASPPFEILSGFGGGACPTGGVPPFAPGVSAGTLDNDAGSYSPLTIRITRGDGEQEITGFSSQLPPGLTANLSGVEKCSDADIALARAKTGHEEEADPACPAGSEIGHTLVGAGVGQVLAYTPGKVYLAGPFEGAPFSIAAITSADVGPFDLGTVVVHLPLFINPETAAVSIPAGAADQIPHIIDGIVVHVRDIRVYIDREKFMLSPTNCTPRTFAATVIGGGADPTNPADADPVTVNDFFQPTNCAQLAFKPAFKVSTSGKTSKADGASLHVDLTYPTGALGNDANIKQVKVDLPKQLPSRLTTLQKACTAAQFNANPAGCPAASLIGTARAVTPIIPVPLEGPAYFVSHGGEAFPDLEIVLQGYGVKIILTGSTFISKAGITSSTFKTVPDQPVTSFELTLPEGPYSALAANGNLCAATTTKIVKKKETVRVHGRKRTVTRKVKETVASPLEMPTEFVAQNGATIHQSTPVSVTSCPKAKPAKKAHKAKAKAKRKHAK